MEQSDNQTHRTVAIDFFKCSILESESLALTWFSNPFCSPLPSSGPVCSTDFSRSVACCLSRNTCSTKRAARNLFNRFSCQFTSPGHALVLTIHASQHLWRCGSGLRGFSNQIRVLSTLAGRRSGAARSECEVSVCKRNTISSRTGHVTQCARFKLSACDPFTNSNPCLTGM